MEIKTTIKEISDLSQDFHSFIYDELILLGKQTGIGKDATVPYSDDEINWFLEDNGYPDLDDDLIRKIIKYMKDVCGTEITVEDLKYKWRNNLNGIKNLISVRSILPEWWRYLYDASDCSIWLIESSINEHRLGGVFVFYNNKKGDYFVFQAITKYIVPTIASNLYPKCQVQKLNTLLDTAIYSLAKLKKVKRIYVKPLDKQMNMLEKYYGYKFFPDRWKEFYNCNLIYQAYGYWMYKDVE